eukprot:SAG31_NODE_15358_length_759_cov_0.793939_1_plen_108_part_00
MEQFAISVDGLGPGAARIPPDEDPADDESEIAMEFEVDWAADCRSSPVVAAATHLLIALHGAGATFVRHCCSAAQGAVVGCLSIPAGDFEVDNGKCELYMDGNVVRP